MPQATLTDSFARKVDYLRISVTDRCDFRCVYCMAETMQFLPRQQVLSLEEIEAMARAFVNLGTRKIRLTGGEPLVRQGVVGLCSRIAALPGLQELCMTSNGSQLGRLASPLFDAGVSRLNISLDSLHADRFKALTRTGDLQQVLAGIDAARAAGFKHTKLNCVVMKGRNDDEILDLVDFALERELDISFIEEMPLGQISEHSRAEAFFSSEQVRERIAERYSLLPSADTTQGPSRYWRLAEAPGSRIGFISPHSHNFCATCNRVRLTVEGRLLLCLGNEHSADLKAVLRANPGQPEKLENAILDAIGRKPWRHDFKLDDQVQIVRFMNMTGG
ncbi:MULTISPECIES: GTP 3',8-cyclase MoaA [unclassified Pseudomonas]|uniref:GTP 3',8-cyclase MoaA n=1 Tax=unclassified Pseudomonas TaxID=196821 RepID=UPI000BD8C9B6|nr:MULTISPECIES: GTP 3',8-cyclase MoaA [unclassified Pseudomonas]PVZ20266.1 cyclic pyranopterin phosphate synthase [Pseudomonas sp. URIL14HWK12:I12]PVZ27332.1 cyclic pyranopterin phosphate synthase [Pseudomonas sp. URIL14HWK12:I10]PVZ38221.1 cyclic pyranopterin phosphate synthase [Pseudomonas sp. URIL14HWK12:I11]SNZ04198.1 cyclic pyranopterin monophosphate synthase subunit MoaA [Pseudomonas sp. URIL14HWK12:I9]